MISDEKRVDMRSLAAQAGNMTKLVEQLRVDVVLGMLGKASFKRRHVCRISELYAATTSLVLSASNFRTKESFGKRLAYQIQRRIKHLGMDEQVHTQIIGDDIFIVRLKPIRRFGAEWSIVEICKDLAKCRKEFNYKMKQLEDRLKVLRAHSRKVRNSR